MTACFAQVPVLQSRDSEKLRGMRVPEQIKEGGL